MRKFIISMAVAVVAAVPAMAGSTVADGGTAAVTDSAAGKRSFVDRLLDYFNDANKTKTDKKFDFSVIGGPHYSTDTKLGLGLVAAGLYRTDRLDTTLPPSDVSLFGDVSTVGFYMMGIRGTNIFPHDKCRLEYTLFFYSFPCKFWGIGYDSASDDANESDMKRWQAQAKASFLWRVGANLYAGPTVTFDYIKGKDIDRPELLDGMNPQTHNVGIGLSLAYDSRDVLTNPKKGVYINLSQLFRPRFLCNDYVFSTTDIRADAYWRVGRGTILAADLRGQFNFGNPSWGMMALLGNSYSMRGYYEGRYRDKHKIEAQVELRQHVWRRNGFVAWLGAGTVFDSFGSVGMRHVLPNYGIGYRWEFKKDVNVRLDYGFGKGGQSGFLFNINEAF